MKRSFLVMLGAALLGALLLLIPLRPHKPPPVPSTAANTPPAAKPILIAHVAPTTGRFAAHAEADRRGVQMAIDEFNAHGGVLGRPIVLVLRNPTLDKKVATQVAADLIKKTKVSFMVGAIHSGIAAAMSAVCQKYGVIFINTNSSSPSESTSDAHRSKFVFDASAANFDRALIKFALDGRKSKRVLLLTEDYVWGHANAAAARKYIAEAGGTVIDEIIVPEALKDPGAIVARISASGADVVVVGVTGDNQIRLFAQVDPALLKRQLWLLNEVDWPELYLAPGTMRPLFGTTWAWNLKTPGSAEFVARYRARYGHTKLDYPGDVVQAAYLATKALLTAIQRAGTTDNHAVIRQLEQFRWNAAERMQDDPAYMDPVSHHVQQTVYIGRWNPHAARPRDGIEIIGHISPAQARDRNEEHTRLESMEATPDYAP